MLSGNYENFCTLNNINIGIYTRSHNNQYVPIIFCDIFRHIHKKKFGSLHRLHQVTYIKNLLWMSIFNHCLLTTIIWR